MIMEDRMSGLPSDILLIILSLLPVRRAAASTTLLSSRWLDLWKHIPNLKFNLDSDRISQLPDQIISLILSSLPFKEAAATSVLSSRWSDSWKHYPNLNFDYDIVPIFSSDVLKYIEIMNSILQSQKSFSLKQFRINIYFEENKSAKWAVTKWLGKCLEFVFLRKVESLALEYCWVEGDDKVVLGEPLREMKTIYGNPTTLIFFQSLKSLQLAYLEVSSQDMELFLRNCPLLEELTIHEISLTSDIEVCGPSLKRLEISACSGGKSVKVSAPNLTYSVRETLLFENVPRLVNAAFDIRRSEFIMHRFGSASSSHIFRRQYLQIYIYDSKTFWTNALPQMPNLKKLSISPFSAYNHSPLPVTRLRWASPRLEEFTLEFSGCCEEPIAYIQDIGNVRKNFNVFNIYLLYGLGLSDHVVDLVTYVSNNCAGLRQIEIVDTEPCSTVDRSIGL